jgi:opacity protein-like surface antigen
MHVNSRLYSNCSVLMLGALTAFASATVLAADLGGPKTKTYETYQPNSSAHRNFYVRGDIGVGRHAAGGFSQDEVAANGGTFISQSISDAVVVGAGLGMQINSRFRLDLTGEYRSTAQIKGLDNVTADLIGPDGSLQANTLYQGNLASYVGLLNGYVDVVKWRGFTPYVGAGVGFAHNKMSGFTTGSSATFTDAATGAQTVQLSSGTAGAKSQTNVAWALMVGTSYDLSPNAKLDLGYRYVNLGSGIATSTGLIDCTCGTTGQPLKLSDLAAHEFRIGIRWQLGAAASEEYRALK